MFYLQQEEELKKQYKNMLATLGSLSGIFSSSNTPYLYYRGHEGIFNRVFGATDHSRSDISFDSSRDGVGIGLKTFLHKNGNTYQKIAEFNSVDYKIREFGKDYKSLVKYISDQRNARLDTSLGITGCENMIYHLVTRASNEMYIAEIAMSHVEIAKLQSVTKSKNTIHFMDGLNEYKFSLSKNTLFKKFSLDNQVIDSFPVNILDNPYDALEKLVTGLEVDASANANDEFVILPLYNYDRGMVMRSTGLNKWNASGRPRDENEISIQVPIWIHKTFPDFFGYKEGENHPFSLKLPNGEILSAKICEQNGKALQSNPNKALGKWLLRDVLKLPPQTVVTMEMLKEVNIDSVRVTKVNDKPHDFEIDFLECGSYEEFYQDNQ